MHSLSIIIPHKNIPNLLKRCLNSIPDIEDIQVIVVDDNSSEDIVDFDNFPGLERNNVEYIFDKQGGGAGHARNMGLKHADADWLIFADADDFFTDDFYSIIQNHFNDDAQLILFKAKSVFSDTLETSDRYEELNMAIDKVLNGELKPQEASLEKPGPCSRMIRRQVVQENDILFDEVMASNDMLFVAKVTCLAKKALVSEEVIYVVTRRRGSLMDNSMKDPENYLCRMEVMIRWNRYLKNTPYENYRLPICVYVARARKFGTNVFCRACGLAIKKKAFFSGFAHFMRTVKRHLHLIK